MQPLHTIYNLQLQKTNSITHAAAAPSNLDAATPMRSAETELRNTIELRAMASEIAAQNRISTTKREKDDCNIMQPFQCDLQAQIPKHPITTHTQAHPKQLEATVTLRQKKNDKPTPAAPVAQTRYLSSPAAATSHGKTQGFALRLPPQNKAHATSCSHYNAVRSSNSQTCTYLRTEQHQNTKWQQSCSHSNAICKHRFQNTL